MKYIQSIVITVTLSSVLLCGCRASAGKQPGEKTQHATINPLLPQISEVAVSIIHDLQLDPSAAALFNFPATNQTQNSESFETVVVSSPQGVSDGFTHKIIIDHQNQQYWVLRTGGIAGVCEKQGPIKFRK
jgi:hypothetical protein